MELTATIVIFFIALLHLYFLVLEMFLWDKPAGLKIFALTKEAATSSKALAANQGLYNGFLAAGLFWGLIFGSNGYEIKIFFLLCIIIAGIFGAVTVNKKILFIQAIPAAIALGMLLI